MFKSDLKKFSFDSSFDEELNEQELRLQQEAEKEKLIQDAFAKGFDAGKKQGDQDAKAGIEANQLGLLEHISSQLSVFFETIESKKEENALFSIALIKKIGQKIFKGTTLEEKSNMAEKMLLEALPLVVEEEKIDFYVQQSLVEFLTQRIDSAPEFKTIKSKLSVLPLSSENNSLAKISWKKGEVDTNPTTFWQKLDAIFAQYQIQTHEAGGIINE